MRSIPVDLLDTDTTRVKLDGINPSHVFFCAWMMGETEAENIRINSTLVRNVLAAFGSSSCIEHVSLVTGTKHYLGPFECYAKGVPLTPFREDHPRLPVPNFYYAQEDEIFAGAERCGFTFNIHRPYTIIGYSIGKAMNLGATLAAYASVCRDTGEPFRFPGSQIAWSGLSEYSDARQVAKQVLWAALTPRAHNQAFNIVNGDQFRWQWLWPRIAQYFGVDPAPYEANHQSLAIQLASAGETWGKLVARSGLQPIAFDKLASPWHTDLDLSRSFEILSDMSSCRRLGFKEYQNTEDSFTDLFDRLRRERIVP